jgi:aquaporin Z
VQFSALPISPLQLLMTKYLTEFIGTFFLVLTVGLVIVNGAPLGAIAIGTTLMVMVYMGGHISGGHYNPAVSLAAVLAGKLERGQLVPYWIAQFLGAFAAVAAVYHIYAETFAPAPAVGAGLQGPWLIEFFFSFALCLVVLNTAMHAATKGNSYYGFAIGFTVAAGAIAGGTISGGAFNPAVGIAPTIVHAAAGHGSWSPIVLYLVAPMLGGALAAWVSRAQEAAIAHA